MASAFSQLKELTDKLPGAQVFPVYQEFGPDNQKQFTCRVEVRDQAGHVYYAGESVVPHKKKQYAKEAAAQAALNNAGNHNNTAQTRAQAWLGDAAQDFVLALLGTRAGLSAVQLDSLSQELLSNDALAAMANVPLVSTAQTATEEEARFGRSLLQAVDLLLAILVPALQEANPALYNVLVQRVQQVGAQS
jgi:hypothetical protein